ncbi:MAG: FAD-dependent oxidoreductase [Erythrobacter sp.]
MTENGFTRRDAIAMAATGTLLSACGGTQKSSGPRVAVVGAGIIGASIAYNLALGGANVTVLERHEIATRASRGTFAWLNATWAKQPRQYHRMNQLGLAGWKELERDLAIPIKWGGSIEWFGSQERQARLSEQIDEQIEWGEPARMIGLAELADLEPNVAFGPLSRAAYSPNDGALDPVFATNTLLQKAVELGAVVQTNCEVQSVQETTAETIAIQTGCGNIEANILVLATGADPLATEKLTGISVPQRSTPGVIAITEPMEQVLGRIIVAPGVHIHQRLDGRIVLGEQEGAPQNEAHAQRLSGRPHEFPSRELAAQHFARIMDIAVRYVPALSQAKIENVHIGWRPLPLDGHPVIGFSTMQTRAYIAIAHSGVSLAPIIGKLAAQEILTGKAAASLNDYRPDRAFDEVRRY